jgi:hypothetical protein
VGGSTLPLIPPPGRLDPVPHHGGAARRFGVAGQLLQCETHLPPPVRVLRGGAGQVLLHALFGEVFLVDCQQLRGRARQKADGSIVQFAREPGICRG